MPLAEVFHDSWQESSLAFPRRSQGRQLLGQAQPGDTIVCQSLVDMFGSVSELGEVLRLLRKRQIGLFVISLDGEITDDDCLLPFECVLESLNSLGQHRNAQKVKKVKQSEREKGRYLGGNRPFGFMIHQNGKLIRNPVEQRLIERMIKLSRQGWSLRAIAAKLSTPATPVTFKTVHRVLQREAGRS